MEPDELEELPKPTGVPIRMDRVVDKLQERGARIIQELQWDIATRDAMSGVNLDEEAANMLRYQQAYAASAQIISVANSLFDTLINAVRR